MGSCLVASGVSGVFRASLLNNFGVLSFLYWAVGLDWWGVIGVFDLL